MYRVVLAALGVLLSLAAAEAARGRRRDVMIWTDCAPETMAQLAQHRSSFTKLSPFNAGIERHADGRVGISSSTDNVTNISSCAAAIHGTFHRSVEYWPCVSVGPGAADPLMPKLFADPSAFIADAITLSKQLNIAGWNLDFEATGQAPNVNQTMWMDVLRFYDAFAKAVKPHGIKTTAAVMCTANVTSPSLCKNGLPSFNDSATAEMVSMMRSSAVQRWISMGTYGLDPPTTVNQIDWFVKTLGADRFGLGTAQVLAPVGDDSDLLLRFSLANAYDIAEIDLFDYETSSPEPCDSPCNLTNVTAPYFDYLERFLGAGSAAFPAGQIWPY